MKAFLKYLVSLIIATVVLGAVAVFVPPVWAACNCTYNEIKSFLVFPSPLVAGLVVVSLTYLGVKKGHSHRKVFLVILTAFVLIFAALGFLIHPMAEYIKENHLPIFQPDYTNGL
jgi:cytochrome bd-type quinol oxidase subunit 2